MKAFAGQPSYTAVPSGNFNLLFKVKRVVGLLRNSSEMKSKIRNHPWFTGMREWLRLKRLEHALRNSRNFQKYCEQIECPTLAEMEKRYQEVLTQEIRKHKKRTEPFSSSTLQ